MDDMKELKSVLRALAVSSPVQLTLGALLRDYRSTMGAQLPLQKYGYRDALQFLKDRCGDCFLFQGSGPNTVLIPIVPDSVKHIDKFVQKQRVNPKMKFKGKRTSVPEAALKSSPNLIASSFEASKQRTQSVAPMSNNSHQTRSYSRQEPDPPQYSRPIVKTQSQTVCAEPPPVVDNQSKHEETVNRIEKWKSTSLMSSESENNHRHQSDIPSMEAYKNFLRRRLPVYESTLDLQDSDSGKCTSESEPRTSSTSSSSKQSQLEQLQAEVTQLVLDSADGVNCTDLMKLYRERYGRELNFSRFGYTCVSALACSLPGLRVLREGGASRLLPPAAPASPAARAPAPAPAPPRRPRLRAALSAASVAATSVTEEDALPWIDFDPDVFPEDCVSFSESIPAPSLEDIEEGAMLEVMVGEVYSPSHFWMYRLGPDYHIAMEDIMDEMTEYYTNGEGATRTLAAGAVRVGHYCSSVYERDWHRSLIVKVEDSDTVKVRHVDYGTVERAARAGLRPLLRRWAGLRAQALRARLAGVRPAAAGRRWPHAAAAAFLRLVQDRRLVANVVSIDRAENILEVFLVDTSTEADVRVDAELVRAGHAEPRAVLPPPAAAPLAESWLFPRFEALEAGATPNFGDISAYLRDGIALDFVREYREHVPAAVLAAPAPPAPSPPPPPSPPQPAPPLLHNRVPLLPLRAPTPPPSPSPPPPARAASPPPAPAPVPQPAAGRPVPAARVVPHKMAAPPPRPPLQPVPLFVFPPPPAVFPYPQAYRAPAPLRPYPSMQLYPAPRPAPPRLVSTGAGEVTLSVSECEIFSLLSSVDANAAHWYIVDAISRARRRSGEGGAGAEPGGAGAAPDSRLNPLASEFRLATTTTQTEPTVRPPPGFDFNSPRF